MKQRLDLALLERGLVPSRQIAQALIMSGRVTVDGRLQDKPGTRIDTDAAVAVTAPALSYVGRGGLKLAGALDTFNIDPAGLIVLDIGASTGGFTDCVLQRGASRVFAVDVGHGQIDWKLRNDPRVVVVEGLNARYLSPGDLSGLAGGVDLATVDVSFISLRLVLPKVAPMLKPLPAPACILALIKPQFEVGRGKVGRGGIVKDADLRRETLAGIARFCLTLGLSVRGLALSPIAGAEGNVEYFAHLGTGEGGLSAEEIDNKASSLALEDPHMPERIRRVGIVIKRQPQRAPAILRGLTRWLARRGIEHALDHQTAAIGRSRGGGGPAASGMDRAAMAAWADMIIVIGGDGTLLSVAREIGASRTPILGVNLGSLGFLAEIPFGEIYPSIEGIIEGRHSVNRRMRLLVEITRESGMVVRHEVLNEVVVNKSALARILDINVEVNGRFMTVFRADGLIVCTPTGSTAYSLSAGGPIVEPSLDAMQLCPICPHTLTNRPVVLPDTSVVGITLVENHGDVYVTIDGQVGAPFLPKDRIRITKSKHPVRLVQFPEKDYFEVLRQKLKWGGRVR